MQASKWFIAFILLLGLGVGGFSLAVGAATTPVAVPNEPAVIDIESGAVGIKHASSTEWTNATSGMTIIVGDTIKTDATGAANINLFDQGVLRLDHDTEITVTSALWDAKTPDVLLGSIFLSTGQLWTRLFNFISPDSSFDVQTTSTVATVRGTVFSVNARPNGETWVYVDDHTVNVKTANNSLSVTNGEHAQVAEQEGKFLIAKKDSVDAKFTDWISKNRVKDARFDDSVRTRWATKLAKHPFLMETAETIRLSTAINPTTKSFLRKRFGLRRKLLDRLFSPLHEPLRTTSPETPATLPSPDVDATTAPIITKPVPVVVPVTPPTITPTTPPTTTQTPTPIVIQPATPAPTPISLSVSASAYTAPAGQQVFLTAILTYSDKHTEDVSKKVIWNTLADANSYKAGRTISNIFIGANQGGTALIEATYTGANERFIENLAIAVTPAPQTNLTAPLY